MLWLPPIAVPTRVSGGGAGGDLGGGGAGEAATNTEGGRRDGENNGRSRVADNDFSGIAHNGFPRVAPTACLWDFEAAGVMGAVGRGVGTSIAAASTGLVAARAETSPRPHAIAPRAQPRRLQPRTQRFRAQVDEFDIASPVRPRHTKASIARNRCGSIVIFRNSILCAMPLPSPQDGVVSLGRQRAAECC